MAGFKGRSRKRRRATINEEDITKILQRYSPCTVLTLLHEVANFPGANIDWDVLVAETKTGITNARECQMLWRHLAYRNAMIVKLEDEAVPLDDDSDLEFGLEASPAVNHEFSAEAVDCVKVLIAPGLSSDSAVADNLTLEVPLTINVPNGQSSQAPSLVHGTNISDPVSDQKRPLPTKISAGGLDGNMPPKKKRKPWSKAEDLQLFSAVQKCGEGNWTNILKGDFKGDRTASQLSQAISVSEFKEQQPERAPLASPSTQHQRWAIIKNRKNSSVGKSGTWTGPQLSEAQLAARHAMSLALDMPVKKLTSGIGNKQARNQSRPSTVGESNTIKSVVSIKRSPPKPKTDPDSLGIKAAAVAAGARIATPSDAASLMMAAQAKKAVHIIPSGGVSVIKRTISGGSAISGAFPNVHHIRSGLSSPALSSQATSSAMRPGSLRPTSDTVWSGPAIATLKVDGNPVESTKPPLGPEAKPKEGREVSGAGNAPKEQTKEDGARDLDNPTGLRVDSGSAPQTQVEAKDKVNAEMEANEGDSLNHDKTTVCSYSMGVEAPPAGKGMPEKAGIDWEARQGLAGIGSR